MLIWIALGFAAVFVLSFWLSAGTARASHSALFGTVVGLVSFVGLMIAYLAVLAIWLRETLRSFVETFLPRVLEQFFLLLEQVAPLKETI